MRWPKFGKYWVIFRDEIWSTDQNTSQMAQPSWESKRESDENVHIDMIESKLRKLDSIELIQSKFRSFQQKLMIWFDFVVVEFDLI